MALSLRVAARAWIFKLYRVVFLYSGFLVYLFEFSVQDRRVWPDSQSLVIRFVHPTGRPSGAAQTTLCNTKKVTKNAATLTAKLDHDGCISQCFLSSSSREIIAKRYRG